MIEKFNQEILRNNCFIYGNIAGENFKKIINLISIHEFTRETVERRIPIKQMIPRFFIF